MKKDLKYFMRNQEPEVITVPGPENIRDEEGNVIRFEIRVLPQAEIIRINDRYRTRSMATDKKGNPIIAMGEVAWKTERDSARASRHLMRTKRIWTQQKTHKGSWQLWVLGAHPLATSRP